jgi:BirA family biotin operon repressor/biotin-[acetyl-CoA-carboxylase] ligase
MNANISEIVTERGNVTRIGLASIGSTNDYAMHLLRTENTNNETVIVADHQHNGKGQRGKKWLSSPGGDLCMSWIIKSPPHPPAVFNMAAALGVLDGLREVLSNHNLSIKWPNDIIITQKSIPKKISGLLIENNWRGGIWAAAVVGIGVNVSEITFKKTQPEFNLPAISVFDVLLKNISPSSLELPIINALQNRVNNLMKTNGIKSTVSEFNSELYGINSEMDYSVNNKLHKGVLLKVEEDGRGVFSWTNTINESKLSNPKTRLHSSEVVWSW